jgi:DNA polymerase elongation subunit (family B)
MTTKRKRLFFDIETSPNIGFFWQSGFKLNIGPQNIIKERAIICICYKWEDEKETHALSWDAKQCDKKMLQDFIKVLNTADETIGHNGDKFDLAWVRTRCLFHGIELLPSYTTSDTLKGARAKFKFNSNKLNYIATFLGIGQKIKTDYDLWKDIVLKKDKKAMERMVKYCKMDVVLLEKVHKALSHHIPAKTHFGVIFGEARGSCPECGSDELIKNNKVVTASGLTRIQYKCKTCNKFHSKTDK